MTIIDCYKKVEDMKRDMELNNEKHKNDLLIKDNENKLLMEQNKSLIKDNENKLLIKDKESENKLLMKDLELERMKNELMRMKLQST